MHKRLSARTAAVLTTLLLSASVVLGTASPAAAHDDFVSSYPTADSTINGSPDEISLMFTGALTGGDDATVVEVIDESGANVAVDPPTVSGDSITQHLSPDAATGIFTVRWKTVSADGHPINGSMCTPSRPRRTRNPALRPQAPPLKPPQRRSRNRPDPRKHTVARHPVAVLSNCSPCSSSRVWH